MGSRQLPGKKGQCQVQSRALNSQSLTCQPPQPVCLLCAQRGAIREPQPGPWTRSLSFSLSGCALTAKHLGPCWPCSGCQLPTQVGARGPQRSRGWPGPSLPRLPRGLTWSGRGVGASVRRGPAGRVEAAGRGSLGWAKFNLSELLARPGELPGMGVGGGKV